MKKKSINPSILILGALLISILILSSGCSTAKSGCRPAKQGKTHDKNVRFNN